MLSHASNHLVLINLDNDPAHWAVVETECYGMSFCREKRVICEGGQQEMLTAYLSLIEKQKKERR